MDRYRPHIIAALAIGLPLIGSHLARMAIGVGDTVMMGWYSVESLAALIIATSLFYILFFLGMGFGISVMGLIATSVARGDVQHVRRVTRMALWLSGFYSIGVLPVMWHSQALLLALGQTPETAALAQAYLRIAGFGMFPVLAGLTLNSCLAAVGRAQIVLWVTVMGIPLNVGLNWILIFGNLGAPELGVRGAAIASMTVQFIQLGMLIAYSACLPETRKCDLFVRFWKFDWMTISIVFRLGLPIGLTMLAEGGLFVSSNIMMGWIGVSELAAHGIALQIVSIVFMAHLGLSNAATIQIGQCKGREDADAMRDVAVTILGMSILLALVAIVVLLSIPEMLVRLYLDPREPETPTIIVLGAYLLFYGALFQLTDALQVIALGLLRGVHDSTVPMWYATISYWLIGVPVAYLLAFVAGFGPAGLWIGLVLGLSCAAVLLLTRFWRGLGQGHWTAPLSAG